MPSEHSPKKLMAERSSITDRASGLLPPPQHCKNKIIRKPEVENKYSRTFEKLFVPPEGVRRFENGRTVAHDGTRKRRHIRSHRSRARYWKLSEAFLSSQV